MGPRSAPDRVQQHFKGYAGCSRSDAGTAQVTEIHLATCDAMAALGGREMDEADGFQG